MDNLEKQEEQMILSREREAKFCSAVGKMRRRKEFYTLTLFLSRKNFICDKIECYRSLTDFAGDSDGDRCIQNLYFNRHECL